MSDAGRLMTSRQFFAELGRLGQRLGEGEMGLEAASRQIALVVKLARIGDPLVDQDQARPVVVRSARAARRRGWSPARRRAATRVECLAVPPSCQASSPHSVRTTVPSRLRRRIAGRDLVADQHDARRLCGSARRRRLRHHGIDAEQLAGRACRRTGDRAPASSGSCRRRNWSAAGRPDRRRRLRAAARRRRAAPSGSRSDRCGGRTRPDRGTRPTPRRDAPATDRRRTRPADSARSPRPCGAHHLAPGLQRAGDLALDRRCRRRAAARCAPAPRR